MNTGVLRMRYLDGHEDDDYSMYIFLPDIKPYIFSPEVIKPHSIDEFIAQLTPDILDDTLNGRKLRTYLNVELELPKFSFELSNRSGMLNYFPLSFFNEVIHFSIFIDKILILIDIKPYGNQNFI